MLPIVQKDVNRSALADLVQSQRRNYVERLKGSIRSAIIFAAFTAIPALIAGGIVRNPKGGPF